MADHELEELDEEDDNVYELMIELRRSEPDHRDAVQKKTFTKWVNNHLQKVNVRILDLYEELRDGTNLLLLLELLCKINLPRERGQLRFHRLQNVQTALEFLQSQQVKLVNIRSEDIVDGNPKLTLGLIWTIILHYQISEVEVVGKQEQMTAKDALLLWAKKVTQGYPSVDVGNFTTSWRDGLAFNAIIHRYRPDLVDFSKLNKASPDQNLEYSFHVAEKELGVPRLLDVEDLANTEQPDEKSIMTYVSSLYEVFPKEPTVQESLQDNEKLFKFEEYCNLAKALVVEINKVEQKMEKQRFPKTIHGIKELIVEYNRYRISEFPEMEASRHSLKMVFRELQALYGPMATWLEFPYECSPRELEVSWTKLVETQDNYNKSLRIELTRLEQMHQVAEKIQKEATLVDASLDDIEERIKSEEEVGNTIDSETRRKHFYQIEKSLVMFETSIKHMLSGVDILVAGRYSRADEIRIKVLSIERRWSEMKDRLEARSTKVLTYQTYSTTDGKKMKLELPVEKTVVSTEETTPSLEDLEEVTTRRKVITITKRTYRSSGGTPTETRTTVARIMSAEGLSDDGSDSTTSTQGRTRVRMKFAALDGAGDKSQRLDAMLTWIRETKDAIEKEDFGLDLPSAQRHQQNHHAQHDAVLAFKDELDKLKQLEAEDRSLSEKIIEIHEEYAALVKSSVNRINYLKSLVEFMSEATKELIWMNQREEPEVSRDWSITDHDIEDLQAHGENLEFDVRDREPHYNMLLTKGENLVQSGHPAPEPIEAYLNAMRSQWWWLTQLLVAFQQHVRNAEMYQQYFQDAHTTEKKMIQLIDRLNREYDVQNISSRDAAEQALNNLTEMKQELVDFKDVVSSLQLLSKKVVPLPQRKSKLKGKVLVDPVCSYKNMQNVVNKGEECLLLDNSEHHSWKITNASSRQCEVPSVCFVIPAPDVEATEFSTRLEIQYKHLLTLWRTRHWNLKQALSKEQVFTQVKIIKSTSPEKGKIPLLSGSKDVEQLWKEIQMPDDQEIAGITERLEPASVSLNEHAIEPETMFETQTVPTLDKQSAQSTLNDLLAWVNRSEEVLKTKSLETLNQRSLSSTLQQVEKLQEEQKQRTPQYDSLTQSVVTQMDPQLQSKLGLLSEKWRNVKKEANGWHKMLVFLLNIAELVTDLENSLRRVEVILIQQPGLTANLKDIQHQTKVIQEILQTEIEPRKDKTDDIRRSLPDLKEFDKARVQAVLERWEAARNEIDNRLGGLVKAEHKLEQFQAGLQNELDWLKRVEEKVQDRGWNTDPSNAESVMEEFTSLYTDIRSQQVPIKTLCTVGHEYTDESQMWEKNLEDYRHSLHHLPESREAVNPLLESAQKGREEIISSLMSMNARYEKLLNEVQLAMENLVETLKRHGKEHKEVEEACLQWCTSIQHLLDWLSDTEKILLTQSASPADVKQLEEQIEEQKRFTKAVYERKKPVEVMLEQSKQFLKGSGQLLSPTKKAELDSKMSILEARWGRLQAELDNRYMRLVRIHEKLTNFEELLHPFLAWLKKAEDQASAILLDAKNIQRAQDKLLIHKHFVDDVKDHEKDLKEVNQSGEDFLHEAKVFHAELERSVATLESTDVASPAQVSIAVPNEKSWVLENKLADINERYSRLLLLISEQGTILDRSWRQLREYDSQATQVLPWLNKAEDTLARYMAQPVKSDPTAIKQQITELKVLQTEVNLHQAEIVAVGVLGHSVQGLIRTPEFERGKTISQRYDELCANISVYQEKLQAALTTSQNFKDGLDVAIKALTELKKQLDKVTPVSRNLIELRNQAQRFKILQVEVNRNGTSVEALNEMFNSQKKKQKESKLKQLNKLWVEVLERSDNRKEELKSVFIMIAKDFERWELGMIKRLDAGELVTSDILVFEEKLQHFQDEVEKMRPAFQSVNQGGHELINLEKNKQQSIILETLDRVNKNWQTLAIKLLNTTAKFDELQEQSEKFYTVYKTITVWLDTIEVRLVSIPPVGLDPDVLSAQMKEQKALQNEAVNYKAQIDLLVGLGKVIISITSQHPGETPQTPLEGDLTSVRTRYDDVWKQLETRNVTLETTVLQMEKYRRLVRNITIFLGRTEKRLGKLEPVAGDTDTIRRQISDHKTLQKEIAQNKGDVELLLKAGNDLLEDREGAAGSEEIQEEIANVRSRMEFIVVASNDRQKELESTWSTVKNLDESVQSLTVQIKQRRSEIEALLSEDDPKNLSRRVKALNHEISSLKYQLANTNESGQEVIRHLEDTEQDPRSVVDKVTGVNNQWDQLQTQLLELKNRFEFKDDESPTESDSSRPFKVTTVKKNLLDTFEVPKSGKTEPAAERTNVLLSPRPFELGKPVAKSSDSDGRVEDKSPFGVTAVEMGTVESLNFEVPSKSRPETKQEEFEWGRPLLGASSDEEDYEDNDGETVVFESAQPVYLEEEPGEVSISLQSSVDKSDDPDEEVIEEYVDEDGRQVKRIAKLTTTKTILRVERQMPDLEMDVDIPSEPKEEVQEYTDEHGQRITRVMRTSHTTTMKTVLRDGSMKVVLKPDDVDDSKLRKDPEEGEQIVMIASDAGRRTQKLRKSVFTTQLKGTLQPVTVAFPSEEESDMPSPKLPAESGMEVGDEDERGEPEERPEVKENVFSVHFEKKVIIPELSSSFEEIPQSNLLPTKTDDQSPKAIDENKDDREPQVFESAAPVYHDLFPSPDDRTEEESPEEVEEYLDENGVRVRRIVRRYVTTTGIRRQQIEPEKVEFSIAQTGDGSPEQVEEYIDENGVRVRRTVRRDVTTTSIRKQKTEPEKVEFSIAQTGDGSPEQVEEHIDENGVRVRRTVRRDVTTTSIRRQQIEPEKVEFSVAQTGDGLPEQVEEYIDENGVRVRRTVRRDVTTTSIRKQKMEPEKVEFSIAQTGDGSPEQVEEHIDENGVRVRRTVRRDVTMTSIRRQQIEPEKVEFSVAQTGDGSPEQVEEYIDENGVRVRRSVRRVFTTTSIKREGQQIEPEEVGLTLAQTGDESPEEVEECIDENGVRVRRSMRRVVTTTSIKREGQQIEPEEVGLTLPQTGDESPEEVEEYIDENGVRVRRSVRRVVTTTSIKREGQQIGPEEVGLTLPQTGDESPEEVEGYIDENGVRVRRSVRRVVTTTSIKRKGQQIEPIEVGFTLPQTGGESPEEVEEYVDENGVRVRRTVTTTSIIRKSGDEQKKDLSTKVFESAAPVYLETEDVAPTTIELPVSHTEHDAPEEFEEYVDEHGVRIRRVVTRTVTRTVHHGSVEGTIGMQRPVEEVVPYEETETVETITPESAVFNQAELTSSRRVSIPYQTTVVQRYLVVIETLYQYVLEHKSLIFIYSSRHMRFNFVLENFLQWMLTTLKKLSWMRAVSWKVDEIKTQLQEIKVFLSRRIFVDLHDGNCMNIVCRVICRVLVDIGHEAISGSFLSTSAKPL